MPGKEAPRASMKDAAQDKKSTKTVLIGKPGTSRANTLREAEDRNQATPYEEWSKHDLYERAVEHGIEGRARMSRKDLINTLRDY